MKKLYKKLAFAKQVFIIISLLNSSIFAKKDTNQIDKDINNNLSIRVLLDEKSDEKIYDAKFNLKAKSQSSWKLSSPHGFIISDLNNLNNKIHLNEATLHIKISNNNIILNDRKHSSNSIEIWPKKELITYNGHIYKGFFRVIIDLNKIANSENNKRTQNTQKPYPAYLINCLNLEDYVESVLPYEGWPGWPDEFNKAFCIVVRTYGLTKIVDGRNGKNKSHYDILNTNLHQTYKGYKHYPHIKKVVSETKDIILCYKNRPIIAMFDICCGGIIPANISSMDFKKAPYLARNYPCYYCKNCKAYEWETKYTLEDVEKSLKLALCKDLSIDQYNSIYGKLKIRDIKLTKTDKAGLALELSIKNRYYWITLTGKKLKSFLSRLKSKCFSVSKESSNFIFKGNGYGHHLGLCQWGAFQMVKEGWNYTNILKFYFPSSELCKLKIKRQ